MDWIINEIWMRRCVHIFWWVLLLMVIVAGCGVPWIVMEILAAIGLVWLIYLVVASVVRRRYKLTFLFIGEILCWIVNAYLWYVICDSGATFASLFK